MITVRNALVTFINIVMSVILFFLGLRMVLDIFNANPATPFVLWVGRVSDNLMYPFRGIFPNLSLANGGHLEMAAMVALVGYAIIAYVVIALIDAVVNSIAWHTHEGRVVHRTSLHE